MNFVTSADANSSSTSTRTSSEPQSPLSLSGPHHLPSGTSGRPSRSPLSSPPTPLTPIDSASVATSTETAVEEKPILPSVVAGAATPGLAPAANASPVPGASLGFGSASSPSSTLEPRVVYGPGTVACLPTVLGLLRLSCPLIVSSPSRIALARRIQGLVPNLDSHILDSAVVNVPARVVDDALDRISGRDVVISVGGASAVGLAKAIGGRKGIPHICIPTTYSGSEMMPLLLDASPARHSSNGSSSSSSSSSRRHGHGSSRRKTASNTSTVRDPRIQPAVIIYDEELTISPSKRVSAPSDSAVMARSTEFRDSPSKCDETVQWSYIHLPGV
ncbi:hypothetical protein G6O67_003894 [Ophiocordyceps sinensis]|uniref:Alcohol dehydrogenase iron-type/glycerol dehydrogenase GldA domain-containing protein n=2 Tax=Ophiocordyceps sinensis TaxID=72228 RepID=A0A8H4PSQ0_9HYPO|nr:maleylacetate reductase [Ophiocordyceps sinensis CO18]KAF4509754.1 hypothetical protein G6O67_003894 [Ophiocordyceps sinensis]